MLSFVGEELTLNTTSNEQSFMLTSLLPFTEYFVVVGAVNNFVGVFSEMVNFTTLEDGELS